MTTTRNILTYSLSTPRWTAVAYSVEQNSMIGNGDGGLVVGEEITAGDGRRYRVVEVAFGPSAVHHGFRARVALPDGHRAVQEQVRLVAVAS